MYGCFIKTLKIFFNRCNFLLPTYVKQINKQINVTLFLNHFLPLHDRKRL
jgi:hypothetical protein